MKSALSLVCLLALWTTTAVAQSPSEMGPDQKIYIVYHYCMMQSAMEASKTEARNEDIYAVAHKSCAQVRSEAAQISHQFPELLAALDAADAQKRANFPIWVKGVRERREKFEAGLAAPRAVQ